MKADGAPDWLPDLVPFDWNDYGASVERAYAVFWRDFGTAQARPAFRGKRMGLKQLPEFEGKCATFWHFVTEGAVEAERTPDRERIERIAWPKAMLLEAGPWSDPSPVVAPVGPPRILLWSTQRQTATRWVVSLPDFSYVVVIDERENFVLPWTAFCVVQGHRREKLRKEYESWRSARKS